jgi:hypothetical protein
MVVVSDLVNKLSTFKENQVIVYDDFKVIIKEKICCTSYIVDFIYNSEEFFDSLQHLLLSYVEIGSQGHLTLFPLEDNAHLNEVGSSEAQ